MKALNEIKSIPSVPDELTADWLHQVLVSTEGFPEGKISSINISSCSKQGATSQVCIVQLQYDSLSLQDSRIIIAKFSSAHDGIRLSMGKSYHNEVSFYLNFKHDVGITIPNCYYAHFFPETNHSIILLEYFPNASIVNVKQVTQYQLQLLMSAIAGLHAKWWKKEDELSAKNIGDEQSSVVLVDRKKNVSRGIEVIRERFLNRHGADGLLKMLNLWFTHADTISHYIKNTPRTLCHNDFYPNQVSMPTNTEEKFCVFDWQDQTIAPCTDDVACFISHMISAWPEHERRINEQMVLRLYYEELVALLVENFSFENFLKNYKISIVKILIRHVSFLATLGVEILDAYWKDNRIDPETDMWDGIYAHHSQAIERNDVLLELQEFAKKSTDYSQASLLSEMGSFPDPERRILTDTENDIRQKTEQMDNEISEIGEQGRTDDTNSQYR